MLGDSIRAEQGLGMGGNTGGQQGEEAVGARTMRDNFSAAVAHLPLVGESEVGRVCSSRRLHHRPKTSLLRRAHYYSQDVITYSAAFTVAWFEGIFRPAQVRVSNNMNPRTRGAIASV